MNNIEPKRLERAVTAKCGGRGLLFEFSFPSYQIKNFISKREPGATLNVELKTSSGHDSIKFECQRDIVEHYLINLAVNQTCFVDKSKIPKSSSTPMQKIIPDEVISEEKRFKTKEDNEYTVNETKLIQYKVKI